MTIDEMSPHLVKVLQALMASFGPAAVRDAVALMLADPQLIPATPAQDPVSKVECIGVCRCRDCKRFDRAVDRVLSSGLMRGYMDDFYAFCDRKISYAEFDRRMSP